MRSAVAHRETKSAFPLVSRDTRRLVAMAIESKLAEVDQLIAILDLLDGDPDLEPVLGAPEADCSDNGLEPFAQIEWADGGADDLEADPCDGPIDDTELDGSAEFSSAHQQ